MSIISNYIKIVEFLGLALEPDYEVVLYDLEHIERGIIAIANGHISGRTVGSPLSFRALETGSSGVADDKDYDVNYNSLSRDNKLLRSSTLYIKEDGKTAALLCINFDDTKYAKLSRQILELCHPNELITKNAFETIDDIESSYESDSLDISVEEVAHSAIKRVLRSLEYDRTRPTMKSRMEVVRALCEKGVFRMKGSISIVAKELSCSEATIYRYLKNTEYR